MKASQGKKKTKTDASSARPSPRVSAAIPGGHDVLNLGMHESFRERLRPLFHIGEPFQVEACERQKTRVIHVFLRGAALVEAENRAIVGDGQVGVAARSCFDRVW